MVVGQHQDRDELRWVIDEEGCLAPDESGVNSTRLEEWVARVINNSYIALRKHAHNPMQGVLKGMDMSPEITDICILYYEFLYWGRQLPQWNSRLTANQTIHRTPE